MWINTRFQHPITHIEDIRKPSEIGVAPVYHQYYTLPGNCEIGDNVGKVNFLWSHQKFFNRRWAATLTDSGYTFEIISGNEDSAFDIDGSNGELTVLIPANFTVDRYLTVRVKVFEWYYQDTMCRIEHLDPSDCVFLDYSVVSGGDGSRSNPYKRWQDHYYGGSPAIGTGTPGKYYLYKRGQVIEDWGKIKNPKISGQLPPYITIGAWGQGGIPKIVGNNNATSERFLDIGSSSLDGVVQTEATNPDDVAYNVRVMDIETDYDGLGADETGQWYPYQISMYGKGHRFHRLKCSTVTIWEQGFFWFRNKPGASGSGNLQCLMQDIETYDSKYRAIKFESGGITGRNFRCYTTLTETETPISAANAPFVNLKYGDCQCTNNTIGLGLQVRAESHTYEWFYLKGYRNALNPFRHTSHDALDDSYRIKNSGYSHILIDGCTDYLSQFLGTGTKIPNGVYFRYIDVVNSDAAITNGLTVGREAENTLIEMCNLGDSPGVLIFEGTTGSLIRNATIPGTIDRRASADIINTLYGALTGAGGGSVTTSTAAPATGNFLKESDKNYRLLKGSSLIASGTGASLEYDMDGNPVPDVPSQGCYEVVTDDRLGTELFSENWENGLTAWNTGGEIDSGVHPGTASSVLVTDQSFTGSYSLRMRGTGGLDEPYQTNNFRYTEPDENTDFITSVWLYIPQVITYLSGASNPFTNILQFKGVNLSGDLVNKPIWVFGLGVSPNGKNYITMTYTGQFWGGSSQQFTPEYVVEIPTDRWWNLKVRLKKGNGNGIIEAWVDVGGNEVRIYRETDLVTMPEVQHLQMSVNNYGESTDPEQKDIYMDMFDMHQYVVPEPVSVGLIRGIRFVTLEDRYGQAVYDTYVRAKANDATLGASLMDIKPIADKVLAHSWDMVNVPLAYKGNALYSLIGDDMVSGGGGGGSRFDRNGLLVTELPNDRPRFTFDAGKFEGVFLEVEGENIRLYSEDIANSYWTAHTIGVGSLPVVTNDFQTEKGIVADKTVFEANSLSSDDGGRVNGAVPVLSGLSYTHQLLVKSLNSSQNLLLFFGGVRSSYFTISEDPTLVSLDWVPGSDYSGIAAGYMQLGDMLRTNGEFLILYSQVEEGKKTSYIKTTSAPVSRPADTLQATGLINTASPYSLFEIRNGQGILHYVDPIAGTVRTYIDGQYISEEAVTPSADLLINSQGSDKLLAAAYHSGSLTEQDRLARSGLFL